MRSVSVIVAALLCAFAPVSAAGGETPRNVILMIGDGMGVAHLTAAKVSLGVLQMERMPVGGLVTTFPLGSFVTDSAASGTAMATGVLTENGMISMTPGGESPATVLEIAERRGMSTGLVATCSITHATPAVFAAHVPSRTMEQDIAGQLAAGGVDVLFGGGWGWFVPKSVEGSLRSDETDLLAMLEARMPVARTAAELRAIGEADAAAALLAPRHLPPAAERDVTLAELTGRAIEILSRNEKGFFLMVEGSQIDWGAHDNDSRAVIAETADFDDAVGIALDFAAGDGATLVVVASDHETGGYALLSGSVGDRVVERAVFSTDGHTAAMTPLLAFGPGSWPFGGMHPNTFIGERLIGYVTAPAGADASADDFDIAGDWHGNFDYSGIRLRIVFRLARDETGSLRAVMDSPDQGAKGIPVAGVVFDGDSLRIDVEAVGGRFIGAALPDSAAIDGVWMQSGLELPLKLRRGEGEPRTRPQDPAPPFPYTAEEVAVENTGAGVTLAGTLTIPAGDGPFPAAVLLTGSGQQDRDETVVGHRPFLVLADHLARSGIAVLRCDDRGVGGSTGSHGDATTPDFAGDASAALGWLRRGEEIDPSRVGLIGHSEGAIIAAMAAGGES
ncbi:MAG: alkaline phosphatase, partial [Candidatus Krumholzibacteria bacterium]|nr:alkaline phosphatase [Candidatus Krumholzibacteria bacterium]